MFLEEANTPTVFASTLNKQINENFEITSNGMMKLKKKKQEFEEQAFMKNRLKEQNQLLER